MAADNREFVNKFANEGGGDIYAEDKRFEELKSATAKTGSQISTLAQYIPLQDTDGNLVKINPQSFQEAVRNVLGSLLANNDKGTTISGIPALSGSGANLDFGSISPANLASVLGVFKNFGQVPSTDLNDIIKSGIYCGYGDSLNFSNANGYGYFVLIVFTGTSSYSESKYCLQIISDMNTNKTAIRTNLNGGGGTWKEI